MTVEPSGPDGEIRNGFRGWELADYEWSETTGRARFVYRRNLERRIVVKNQPMYPHHDGFVPPN